MELRQLDLGAVGAALVELHLALEDDEELFPGAVLPKEQFAGLKIDLSHAVG